MADNIDNTEIGEDFISLYLQYTSKTECPTFFHRWTAVTSLAAYIGRSIHFNHGHFTIHPNLYVMLIGSPGTKKSSAIKIGAKLLKQAGYKTFAAKKTRQEKFLMDLAEASELLAGGDTADSGGDILDRNLFGDNIDIADSYANYPPAECFVAADEFNNFIGISNTDFMSILGELWDFEGVYDHRLKNSKSIYIPEPTINILGGNTPTGFSTAFPPEAIGQGFFSRLLLVHGEPSGVKYTFPPEPDAELQLKLIAYLHAIKESVQGEVTMTPEATAMLDKIYNSWTPLADPRFEHYANRRLTHLLKLCLVFAASKIQTTITTQVVIEANTLLSFTEHHMPKALGEFGRAKNSTETHKVMTIIDSTEFPITFKNIWKRVSQDFTDRRQLIQVIENLQAAEKIQVIDGKGYLPVRSVKKESYADSIDESLLTETERSMV
jgi:hypothetical protein